MFRAVLRPALRHLKIRTGSAAIITRQLHQKSVQKSSNAILFTSFAGLTGYLLLDNISKAHCAEPEKSPKRHEIIRDDLPFFTEEELSRHDNKYHIYCNPGVDTFDIIGNAWEIEREAGIWVSFGVGVYDITNLIDKHGNPKDTILLAAGLALDPFWEDEEMKKLHDKPYIYDMLEKCRVGNLKVSEK